MNLPPNITVVKKLSKTSKVLGYSVIIIGLLVVIGWILQIGIFIRLVPGWPTMKPITAVCFALYGFCLVSYSAKEAKLKVNRIRQIISKTAIYFVFIVSILEVIKYTFGIHSNALDILLDEIIPNFSKSEQIMTFLAAICFSLLSVSIIMLHTRIAYFYPQITTSVVICLSLMGIFNYLFGTSDRYDLFGLEKMALHTAMCFLLCSVSLLLLKPQYGWLAIITSDTLGGKLVRTLLVRLIIMLLILIEIRYIVQKSGYIDSDSGVVLSAIIGVVLICYAVIRSGNDLACEDVKRKSAEGRTQQLNQRLEKRTMQLENANEELQQIVYIASHDLQEPLKTITNFSGLIYKKYNDKLDNNAATYFGFLNDAVTRMRKLIRDVLSYGGTCRIKEFSECNCNLILTDVINNLKTTIEESDATIEIKPLPTIHCHKELAQLFQNLISNAIKYRRKGVPPVITINSIDKGDKWLFSISDNGIGIKPDYFGKIFQIFQRLHAKHEFEGSGIGLAICKKIVECHGGEIWVESEEGKGSTFYFTISKTLNDDQ